MNSACFLNNKNQIYIITTNFNLNINNSESIKVYNLEGTKIKEINDSKNGAFFIDVYYDKKFSKNFS